MGRKKQDFHSALDFNCHQGVPQNLIERVGFLLGQTACFLRMETQKKLETIGLNQRYLRILELVTWRDDLTQLQIGETLNIDRTTMVSVMDALEAQGLIERKRHPRDRRAHIIQVTEAGQEKLAQAQLLVYQAETHFLQELSEAEQDQLKTTLQKLHADYLSRHLQVACCPEARAMSKVSKA